jgi:hypothetical protein
MDDATAQLVRSRANHCCEYCHLPQTGHQERFSIDHVIARKHGGADDPANLALCCLRCNLYKGTDLTTMDPQTGQIIRLFNPREQSWEDHFTFAGASINGLTPSGRATVSLLNMNVSERVRLREALGIGQ